MAGSDQANSEQANSEQWYIVKQVSGVCQILTSAEISDAQASDAQGSDSADSKKWGPFASQGEAIARRVGLIRAGKCQPL